MTTYKDAGVNIDAADEATAGFKGAVKATHTKHVLADIGLFGGLYEPDLKGYKEPVLVASSDGVGTKLKIAVEMGVYDTVGQDLVNHCINDILVQGAKPLFFLDYVATSKLKPNVVIDIVKGFAAACKKNGVALIGGETAELPGIYHGDDFDLAGFVVGIVDKGSIIDGRNIKAGDVILGLPSNGLHTNGYSLAIKTLLTDNKLPLDKTPEGLDEPLGEALLKTHASYLATIMMLLDKNIEINGLAHITGGGLIDNVPRILPKGLGARFEKSAWSVPKIFSLIQKYAKTPERDLYRTFNMGVGLTIILKPAEVDKVKKIFEKNSISYNEIGTVTSTPGVQIV